VAIAGGHGITAGPRGPRGGGHRVKEGGADLGVGGGGAIARRRTRMEIGAVTAAVRAGAMRGL